MKEKTGNKNPLVSIATNLAGILLAITALIVVFSRENIWILAPVAASIALLGIILGYLTTLEP